MARVTGHALLSILRWPVGALGGRKRPISLSPSCDGQALAPCPGGFPCLARSRLHVAKMAYPGPTQPAPQDGALSLKVPGGLVAGSPHVASPHCREPFEKSRTTRLL